MKQRQKTSRMTLDKLATMTQEEFRAIRRDMATKEDLKHFATKEDLRVLEGRIFEEVRQETTKVIQSNDRVVTKLDTFLQDRTAHDSLHKRITNQLQDHDGRIKKLEETEAR